MITLNGARGVKNRLFDAVEAVTIKGKSKSVASKVDIWAHLGLLVRTNQLGRYLELKVPLVVKPEEPETLMILEEVGI